MAQTWMSHGTHLNEPWYTPDWVMAHTWMRHGTHMNESCHTHEWVRAHPWMSHGTHLLESWHTYECVMAHIWMSHVKHTSRNFFSSCGRSIASIEPKTICLVSKSVTTSSIIWRLSKGVIFLCLCVCLCLFLFLCLCLCLHLCCWETSYESYQEEFCFAFL